MSCAISLVLGCCAGLPLRGVIADCASMLDDGCPGLTCPQHLLYLLPLPHGQGSFLPGFTMRRL
jgi:hypothetical protein